MRKLMGAAALLLATGSAGAQDLLVYGGAELEFLFEEEGPGTGTNTYLSGYVEVEASGIYGGLLGKVASDDILDEINLYFGYRNETAGGLAYTVYYTRYYYPNDGGDCCGEFAIEVDAPLGAALTGSADVYFVPETDLASAYVGAAWALSDQIEISATYGSYEVEGAGSEQEWDIGASYFLGEETAVDLRWYDGSEYVDGYLGLSLTWDTTIAGG
jgi:hypothetical protein